MPTRREFLISTARGVGVASLAPLASVIGAHGEPSARSFVRNRTPLAASAFYPLPLGSVMPGGWLLRQLRIQADGLGGHLDEVWPDVGFNSGWLGGKGESWERGPYFVDGLLPLAWLLDDATLKAKALRFVEWTLATPRSSGMFGPVSNDDWWPRMVMLKALTQFHDATGDARVLPLMSKYFHYQLTQLPTRPLRDWGRFRWQDEVLSVLWLYNRTGDAALLKLAKLLMQQGHDWQAQFADFRYTERCSPQLLGWVGEEGGLNEISLSTHGVNNGMALKASPIRWLLSGASADREGLGRQLAALDRYHGLPNGIFSADEHFAGRNPSQGTELCTVVESMFSLEQALAILGDATLGDRLERLAFNALPGAFTADMWAHQYNQQPNQVECSLHRQPWTTDGPESNLYGLEPNFGCCAANFHQGWPKFAASLYMRSADDGLAAVAYAPCSVHTSIRGTPVNLLQETDYPFRNTIAITLHPASAATFPLLLRIPKWSPKATIRVNGKPVPEQLRAGSFARFERRWAAGDRVEIAFDAQVAMTRGFEESVTLARGPLVFSLPIQQDWRKLRTHGRTADWQVYPTSAWNYGLKIDQGGESVANAVGVSEGAVGDSPFSADAVPVSLRVKGRRLPQWRAQGGVAQPVPLSPVASDETEEELRLIPYAAAKLRITAFPVLKS